MFKIWNLEPVWTIHFSGLVLLCTEYVQYIYISKVISQLVVISRRNKKISLNFLYLFSFILLLLEGSRCFTGFSNKLITTVIVVSKLLSYFYLYSSVQTLCDQSNYLFLQYGFICLLP